MKDVLLAIQFCHGPPNHVASFHGTTEIVRYSARRRQAWKPHEKHNSIKNGTQIRTRPCGWIVAGCSSLLLCFIGRNI